MSDIIVNKVIKGDETYLDLTNDTVSEGTLLKNRTAHNSEGIQIQGVMEEGGGSVTGVKGDDEPAYRDGNVNITAANIGTYTTSQIDALLNNKVDAHGTDSLMTNAEHVKLAGIEAGAEENVIESISLNGEEITPVNKAVALSVIDKDVNDLTNYYKKSEIDTSLGAKQNIVLSSALSIGGQTVTEVEEALGSLAGISKPMTGATSSSAGKGGFVPSPSAGDENKALFGDGTWKPVSGGGGGHTILDEDGLTYPQRSKLKFEGAVVSDDETNDKTVVETVNPVDYEEDIYGVNLLYFAPFLGGGPAQSSSFPMTYAGLTIEKTSDGRGLHIYGQYDETENLWIYTSCARGSGYKNPNLIAGEQYIASYLFSVDPTGLVNPSSKIHMLLQVMTGWLGDEHFQGSSKREGNYIINTFTMDSNPFWGVRLGIAKNQHYFTTDPVDFTIYPMLRKATIKDDTYRPYNQQSIQHQLTDQTNVLGAKNLLPYPYGDTTKTTNGITFTVMEDGTVIANGTATKASFFNLLPGVFSNNVYKGCIFTGLTSKGSKSTFYLIADYSETGNSWKIGDSGYGLDGLIIRDYPYVQLHLYIPAGATVNNLIFKPMLRLASDPDDTYVPYAMTNRELTEVQRIVYTTESQSLYSVDALSRVVKCGRICIATLLIKSVSVESAPDGQQWTKIISGLPLSLSGSEITVPPSALNHYPLQVTLGSNATSIYCRGGSVGETYRFTLIYITK